MGQWEGCVSHQGWNGVDPLRVCLDKSDIPLGIMCASGNVADAHDP